MKERIRVSTGRLREKGSQWEETLKQTEVSMQEIREEIEHVNEGFYCGAASQIQKAFDKLAQEGEQRIRELCAHVKKLQDMAGNYEEAEMENEIVTADY